MKITLYYYYNTSAWAIDPIDISTFERDKKYSPNNIYIKEEIVSIPDVEVPSRAFITKEMVTMLEEQNKEIQAEAQANIQANKNKIQSLLCIENKGDFNE